jgi:hypothetical protein
MNELCNLILFNLYNFDERKLNSKQSSVIDNFT